MNQIKWIVPVMMIAIASLIASPALAENPPRQMLGDLGTLQGWNSSSEVTQAHGQGIDGKDCASFPSNGEAIFAYPAGKMGWYKHGFRPENDGTCDWRDYYGLQFDIKLPDDRLVRLMTTIRIPDQPVRLDYVTETHSETVLAGKGWHHVTLPWSAFDFQQAQPAFLKFVRELNLRIVRGDEAGPPCLLQNASLIRAPLVALDCEVRGKSAAPGKEIQYEVTLSNCSDGPEAVSLVMEKHGWEEMSAIAEPSLTSLAAGETQKCRVRVKVSDRVPPGGHETQTLLAIANGDANSASRLTFVTACQMPHPNILHTAGQWAQIRENVKKYDWAKRGLDDVVQRANNWSPPQVAPPGNNTTFDDMGPFLFATPNENGLMACGIAYQLTGEKKYAQKVAAFLLHLSDPKNGYPVTLRGCNQSLVQEGHFFQHIAMSYDNILDSGVLSDADQDQINRTLRIFIETIRLEMQTGHIGNWNVSEYCGALYCSLAMEDLSLADRCLNTPSGLIDQLEKGTMDDGWWYECSISYNTWVASEFCQVALAMKPWGMNLDQTNFPASYTKNYSLVPWAMQAPQYGMNMDKFGPVKTNYINIKRMWDALPAFADFNGVIFGINDSTERALAGNRTEVNAQPFEIAYYLYRDPAYARIIRQGQERDLLYGVPDLPDHAPDLSSQSAYADNVGVVMLRSQNTDRPQSDRIQATLHYGTHGGYHGHFDRTNLLSLMRYGKSFYNPEMIWYGYEPYMYKFYVQSSINKNMVVVDQKMQEPVESDRLLFHSGKLMQATAVQTNARWSHEPFGGMVYDWFKGNLADKMWSEGRSFPLPPDAPAYGDIGPYTDRVLQRRLLIVADDYIVLADYLKGQKEHTFDNLYQFRGFRDLQSADKKFDHHDAQMNSDPRTAAQFVTDCNWYQATAPARATFDDPAFHADLISLWPEHQQIMIATAPEVQLEEKQLSYTIRGDGKSLADGKSGAWVLGQTDIDLPVEGLKQLELETKVAKSIKPTVFWGNARLLTKDGKEIPLDSLPVKFENVLQPPEPEKDYFSGPIKIAGTPFDHATPAQPQDGNTPAIIRIDLSNMNAVRFKATLGGDFPLGDESGLRKTYSIRSHGSDARFLTLIEPHAGPSVIKQAVATDADHLKVELTSGAVQTLAIHDFDGDGKNISVEMTDTRGNVVQTETTLSDHK
jgi:hypothetical protein